MSNAKTYKTIERVSVMTAYVAFSISAVLTIAAGTMSAVINSGVKGFLTALVDIFGIDAGLDIASNGVEYLCTAAAGVFCVFFVAIVTYIINEEA